MRLHKPGTTWCPGCKVLVSKAASGGGVKSKGFGDTLHPVAGMAGDEYIYYARMEHPNCPGKGSSNHHLHIFSLNAWGLGFNFYNHGLLSCFHRKCLHVIYICSLGFR